MFTKVDRSNKGVTGLPDTPNLSTAEMQEKFDELGVLSADGLNNLIDELEDTSGAGSLGIESPTGYEGENNVQAFADDVYRKVRANTEDAHSHDNKSVLDTLTEAFVGLVSRIAATFVNITGVSNTVIDTDSQIPTSHAIVNFVQDAGGGDMMQASYDRNGDGVVNAADYATTAGSADTATSATSATTAASATMANDAVTMGGNSLSYEDGNFYIQHGTVKKKLGSNLLPFGSISGLSSNTVTYDLAALGIQGYEDLTAADFLLTISGVTINAPEARGGLAGMPTTARKVSGDTFMAPISTSLNTSISYNSPILTISGLQKKYTVLAGSIVRPYGESTEILSYNTEQKITCYIRGFIYIVQ